MTEFILFIISSIIGTLGHFLYNIFKNNIIGFLFAKNESTFEHLKLGITPILLLSIVEKYKFMNNNILAIKGFQVLVFSLIIIIFFYGRKIFIKKDNAIFNIILFYVSLFISYIISFLLLNIVYIPMWFKIVGCLLLVIFLILYLYSHFYNPNYLIFKNPLNQEED